MFVRRLERHLSLWIGLTLTFLLLNALVWSWSVRLLGEYGRAAVRAHRVLARLNGARAALGAAESGQRGYLITGDERELEPYRDGRARLRSDLDELARLTAAEPTQQARLDHLRALAAGWLDELEQTLRVRNEEGTDAALGRIRRGGASRDASEFRRLIATMADEQEAALARQGTAQETMLRRATLAFGLALLLLAALLGIVNHLLLRDVRERRNSEHALREAKEIAENASRAKDQFLAMLSHELRTPLTPVLLSATAALVDEKTPAALLSTFEMIRRNVELEARLIDDLLDVMRIIRGKMPFQFEIVDVHTLLRQTLEICRSETLGRRLELAVKLDATEHYVRGDPARLQQVFWNLVKNATKFTPEGGRIVLRTANQDGRIAVNVIDNGAGIEPELLPRIFNAFEQGADPRAQKLGGLGLGLAICRSITEAHGGTIRAQSEGRDRGANFTFELATVPAGPRGTPAAGPNSTVAEAHPSRRILLVEDDPMTLRIMARLLREVGHDVVTAAGCEAAVAAVRDDTEIVISDIGLPDGSGFDLMRRLRADHPHLAGVALTGFGMDDDVEKSQQAGFGVHLTKPIDFSKLEWAIRTVKGGA
ncbi:MAG: CHASE3 domain-containing protein [Isosphaeraceae bacterium]|nr:CHASE3 domain-containing protein [Isosphaeraceae bacterium]